MAYLERPIADRLHTSPHLQRIIERVHAAGPRPVAEMLAELLEHSGADAAVLDHLEAWARINPDDIRALEGDRFSPPPLADAGQHHGAA